MYRPFESGLGDKTASHTLQKQRQKNHMTMTIYFFNRISADFVAVYSKKGKFAHEPQRRTWPELILVSVA